MLAYRLRMASLGPLVGVLDPVGNPIGKDFAVFWAAGVFALDGRVDLLADPAAFHDGMRALFGEHLLFHYFPYAPNALLLLLPLGGMSYWWGLALWTIGSVAILLWALRVAGARDVPAWLFVTSPALLANAFLGQNGSLSAGLLIGGFALAKRRPHVAGLLLGFLTYKPHLGIAVPFVLIALKAWRAILATVVASGAMVVASVLLWGASPWRAWLEVAIPLQRLYLEQLDTANRYMMLRRPPVPGPRE